MRTLRALAVRALHVVAVFVLLTGIAQAGSRYFYCPLMDAVLSASCCDHTEKPSDAPELRRTDCCEKKSHRALPAGAISAHAERLAAPLVAIQTAVGVVSGSVPALPSRERFSHRTRNGPPSPAAARAELMVFLI